MRTAEDNMTVLFVIAIVFALSIGAAQPYFEAKSFNKLTGGNATWWDALWTELRVDGSSQKK